MGSVKSGYSISPVSRDQNLLKVMPGFHSTLSPSTQKPCSIVGTKIPSPRVHHFATPTPPALAITSPGSTSATFLRFSMTKYLHAASKDRKQGTSILDLSTLGKSQSYVTGSPVFEPLNSNKGGEIGITPRRNTLDPSQLLGKVVRRNSYSPAFAELKNIRRNSLRNSFVDEKLSVSSKILGSGGFGAVYLGVLNRNKVAVKKFHTQKKNLKAKAESFRSELTAKRLVHPNVVRILATSDVEDFSKGVIVMEYVGDRNLHQELLQSKRPLSRRTMLSYALDLARALDFIHCNSVVHLDVKPANVLITTEGSCKLGDFGCCQVSILKVQKCTKSKLFSQRGSDWDMEYVLCCLCAGFVSTIAKTTVSWSLAKLSNH